MTQIQFKPEVIRDWIMNNHKSTPCVVCEGNEFDISPRFFVFNELNTGVARVGYQLQNMVVAILMCKTCKNMLMFNAAGIMFQIEQNKKDLAITQNLQDPGVPIQ